MIAPQQIDTLNPQQMRQALLALMAEVAAKDELLVQERREVLFNKTLVEKLTHEVAILKRLKFVSTSEQFCAGMSAEQRTLLEDTLDGDLAQASAEADRALGKDKKPAAQDKQQPKRAPLPPHLPRRELHHEPGNTMCGCGCQMNRIGQDVSEKLDYVLGVFTVDRHIRGKWACACCEMSISSHRGRHFRLIVDGISN